MIMFAFIIIAGLLVFPVVSFATVEKTDGFICPVLISDAVGAHNPQAVPIGGGHYSIIGPDVNVPIHATNADGAGVPGGPHSMPGDTDYAAIWAD